ncbi:MAG: hypothetical protein HOM16_07060 [Woeseia sp.]|nr:hypothetical protein [Woeseia sp.]
MSHATLIPQIVGDWWTIATSPDIGDYGSAHQQPMDFGLWRARDGRWQLGACIRRTACGGEGRLLWRWESESLLREDWPSAGLLLESDVNSGETLGGLQAPYVIAADGQYQMFYGDWVSICRASSLDGKQFSRHLQADGKSALFNEGQSANTRDPMVFVHGGSYFAYYTGVVHGVGAIYCRTSRNLHDWSPATIVSRGGAGGCGASDAECAFVTQAPGCDSFYLFRWHSDGNTSVYCSDDLYDFGIDHDDKKIASLPVEVARIIESEDGMFISSLMEDYTGIRLARFEWQAG